MASDSRITTTITKQTDENIKVEHNYILTDSAYKTFSCPNRSGISYCGNADINGKPMSFWINKFIDEQISEETKVSEVPQKLLDYILSIDNMHSFTFHVCGYETDNEKQVQKIYRIFTKSESPIIDENEKQSQGMIWNGFNETINKLLNNQINCSKIYKAKDVTCMEGDEERVIKDALVVEGNAPVYSSAPIPWGNLYLQDATDLAKFLIDATMNMMRFELVDKTVGGPIDILIIKPDKNVWLHHKQIQ